MTLRMTCSNGLTANKYALGLCAALACVLPGCGHSGARTARIAPVRGYADLDVLVRRHPGWAGVAQYDLALMRLRNASVRLDRPAPDPQLAVLPADDAAAPPSPTVLARGEKQQLEAIRQAQVSRVRERRTLARRERIAVEKEAWQREAEAEYVREARRAQGEYLRRVRRALADRDAQRLNLSLQIKALQDIVTSWKASTPPTPRLAQARADLAQKQALLSQLEGELTVALQFAINERHETIASARAFRVGYVQYYAGRKEAELLAQDERQTQAFAHSLAKQEQALLQSQSVQAAVPVAPAGSLGAELLPANRPAPALSAQSAAKALRQLAMAQSRLQAQRARWVAFIYDDTRAAALDAAQKRHWIVQFGKTGPGASFTAPLAQILASQGWKT